MAQTCSPQLQGSTSLRCVWELQAEQGTRGPLFIYFFSKWYFCLTVPLFWISWESSLLLLLGEPGGGEGCAALNH